MLMVVSIILILTILLGLYLYSFVRKNVYPPKTTVMVHGAFAVLGIAGLIWFSFSQNSFHYLSLTLLILAACGGVWLFMQHLSGKPLPKAIVMGHACMGIAGFVAVLFLVTHYYF